MTRSESLFDMPPNFSNRTTGIAAVDRKLAALASKEQRRIVRKAMTAGLAVGRKAIRSEVSALPISPQLKRALRTTIASSFKRDRRITQHAARVGMGLGKRKPARRSGKNDTGVGISKHNVHWFLLGTKTRTVKTLRGRRLRRPRVAGQIKAVPAVANAGRKAAGEMIATVRRTALAEIESTVQRMRGK